ncbi:MAG: hypothetical protein QFB87_00570 [Patescibacteria group bacterium]|nr:hypothetical protein [Patescibacteria group bacterium]
MSPFIISFMMAAGAAAFVYSKAGPRLGYGNAKNVWTVTGVCFVIVFLVFITLLTLVIHL